MRYPLLRLIAVLAILLPPYATGAVAYRDFSESSSAVAPAVTVAAGVVGERTSCGSVTPTITAGSVGDLLVAQVIARQSGATVTMAGWNTLYSDTASAANYKVFLFYRTATSAAANGDPRTITQAGTCNLMLGMITRFGNVDPIQPLETFSGGAVFSNAGNADTGTQTVNVVNSMLLIATFVADNRTVTQDASFTQLYYIADSSGSDGEISLNYRFDTTTGTKGAFTNMDLSGTGNDPNHGVLFAVRPGATLTLTVPAATVDNDVMVAGVSFRHCSTTSGAACTTTVTAPAGWTLVNTVDQTTTLGSNGYGNRLFVYYRVASSEPASYTWTLSGNPTHTGAVGGIISFSGVDTTSPVVISGGQATASNGTWTHAAPSINTGTVTNTMLVSTHSVNSSGTWTPQASMTEQVEISSAAPTNDTGITIQMNHELQAAAGVSGTRTSTLSNPPANDVGATHMLALRPGVQFDHFAISHDGVAINCMAENITIAMHKSDHTVDTTYIGTLTLSTSTGKGDWTLVTGSGTLNNGAANDGAATYSMVAGDNGAVVLGLKDTTVETLNIGVTDGTYSDTTGSAIASEDSNLAFAQAGFQFLADSTASAIGTQIAGKSSAANPGSQTLELQAIRTSDSTGACEAALLNSNTIELAFECENPATCTARQVAINGIDIAGNADGAVSVSTGSYTGVSLDFGDATDSTATFTLNYPDAGQIQLHARYNIPLDDGSSTPSGIYMGGASNSFVVRPFGFSISGPPSGRTGAASTVFTPAGQNFNTTLTAVVWESGDDTDTDGVPDSQTVLSANAATPNFGLESAAASATLSHTLAEPSGGTAGQLSGAATVNFTGFSSGARTESIYYSEVGIINLFAQTTNYLASGQNITAGSNGLAGVGRFIPSHFAFLGLTTLTHRPDIVGCVSTFTYLDEPMRLVFQLEAQNVLDARTLNYLPDTVTPANNFARLAVLDPTVFSVLTGTGALNTQPDLTSRLTIGAGASNAWQTGVDAGRTNSMFVDLTVERRNDNTLDGAFTNVAIGIGPQDLDGVQLRSSLLSLDLVLPAGDDHYLVANNNLRFGRMFLENAYGSELLPLTIPLRAEFYSGAQFALNTDDGCTTYDSVNITFANRSGLAADPTASGAGILSGGSYNTVNPIQLSAPGAGQTGSVDAILSVPAYFDYDWDNDTNYDNDPRSKASFGIYDGPEDNQIYIREVF